MPDFRHSNTARLYEYWRSLADGKPPHFRLWDPIQIPKLMPFVSILELNEDDEFVHRFAGTGICEFVGIELTGRLLKDFFTSPEEYVGPSLELRAMLELPCGELISSVVRSASGRECVTEDVILPLCGHKGEVDRLVVFVAVLEVLGFGEKVPSFTQSTDANWIDLGFGVPDLLSTGAPVS